MYSLIVRMTINQDDKGKSFFEQVDITDSYPKVILDEINPDKKDLTPEMIDCRIEALIAGLANCIFSSEQIGHQKTHESLQYIISQLETYFSNARLKPEINEQKDENF